ncbi:MAG: hypothetical protein GQ527_12195 [Bacteroidales bacterium]|nr:hypothetical protein [Bacteroidales bacterium]
MGQIRKKRKPSKKFTIRLSSSQSNSLINYCMINNISPNKLIKSNISDYLVDFTDERLGKEYHDKMQLSLFLEKENEYEQLDIFSRENSI